MRADHLSGDADQGADLVRGQVADRPLGLEPDDRHIHLLLLQRLTHRVVLALLHRQRLHRIANKRVIPEPKSGPPKNSPVELQLQRGTQDGAKANDVGEVDGDRVPLHLLQRLDLCLVAQASVLTFEPANTKSSARKRTRNVFSLLMSSELSISQLPQHELPRWCEHGRFPGFGEFTTEPSPLTRSESW